jgi:hypothetical protein
MVVKGIGISGIKHILRAEIRPTPNPAKKRPARKRSRPVEATWRMTPKMKTKDEATSDRRRPMLSASKGDARAPKKVPAERMETTAEDWSGEMLGLPLVSVYPVEKSFCQKVISRIPEIVPVS